MSMLQKLTKKLARLFIIMMFMAGEYTSEAERKEVVRRGILWGTGGKGR